MAITNWTLTTGGNFDMDLGWSTKHHPVAGDTANLTSALTGPYEVDVTNTDAAEVVNIGATNAALIVESGTVFTVGTINMTKGTLAVISESTIAGGTIIAQPAGNFIATDGTLDAVTWQGTLGLLGVVQSSLLSITTSLNVLNAAGNGPGEIDVTGPGATMNFDSSMTLNGTGGNLVINIGTSSVSDEFFAVGSSDILTLGTAVSLNQVAAGSTIHLDDVSTDGTIVNDGMMTFNSGAGSGAFINPGEFINNGGINLTGGGATAFSGEDIEIAPSNALTVGATGRITITDFGKVDFTGPNGNVDMSGTISVSGTSSVDLDTASVAITDNSGTGAVEVSTGSKAEVNDDYKGAIVFLDATGTLALDQPGSYSGTIVGLSSLAAGVMDVVDLLNTSTNEVTGFGPYVGDALGGTLTVMDNTTTIATLRLLGNYTNALFGFAADSAGSGTDVFVGCFATGTRIATPSGEVAVEDLRTSQTVMTAEGDAAPIVWLGHRHVDCRHHPEPSRVWPVRVRAGAFGEGLPRRDLWLSPDHAVFVDDVLIPIKELINGLNIEQVPVDTVTYHHVELPAHDLLLAEGLKVESYLDVGDRSNFADGGGAVRLHADFTRLGLDVSGLWETLGRAPLVVGGPKLEAARRLVQSAAAVSPVDVAEVAA